MTKLLWLNWSGGGNLPPSLGVARVLVGRGHELAFAGRPEMVPRVRTAGFRAIEISVLQPPAGPTTSHSRRSISLAEQHRLLAPLRTAASRHRMFEI